MRSKQLTTRQTRLQLQWAGLRIPCNAHTAKWKGLTEEAQTCTLCKNGKENVSHIQTQCAHLHDAYVKAHNDCWQAIWTVLEPSLKKAGYETWFETDLSEIPEADTPTQHRRRRPDGVAILKYRKTPTQPTIALFDFTRTGRTL